MSTTRRKDEHLAAAMAGAVASHLTTGFERWALRHRALPGIDLDEVDLSTSLWGRPLRAPLLISSMTGGSAQAGTINRRLAAAAERHGIAMALGSMRAATEHAELAETYAVRSAAPTVPVLGNVGTVGTDPAAVRRLCRTLELDGLVVHLNPLQEAIQPEGSPAFKEALTAIRRLVDEVGVPVIVKEVGFGLAPEDVALLLGSGVAGVDVAGAGGTNWALVEGRRSAAAGRVAAAFADWGWPTEEALRHAVALRQQHRPDALVVASGGITDGVEVAKALCLGADLVGLARRLLAPAATSAAGIIEALGVVLQQLRVAAFATGARSRADLTPARLVPRGGAGPGTPAAWAAPPRAPEQCR